MCKHDDFLKRRAAMHVTTCTQLIANNVAVNSRLLQAAVITDIVPKSMLVNSLSHFEEGLCDLTDIAVGVIGRKEAVPTHVCFGSNDLVSRRSIFTMRDGADSNYENCGVEGAKKPVMTVRCHEDTREQGTFLEIIPDRFEGSRTCHIVNAQGMVIGVERTWQQGA